MFAASAVMAHGRGELQQPELQDLLLRWLLHQMCDTLAGMVSRLGSPVAVATRAYMWPSWDDCFRVVGLLTWQLRDPRVSVEEDQVKAACPFMAFIQKSISTIIYWSEQS